MAQDQDWSAQPPAVRDAYLDEYFAKLRAGIEDGTLPPSALYTVDCIAPGSTIEYVLGPGNYLRPTWSESLAAEMNAASVSWYKATPTTATTSRAGGRIAYLREEIARTEAALDMALTTQQEGWSEVIQHTPKLLAERRAELRELEAAVVRLAG